MTHSYSSSSDGEINDDTYYSSKACFFRQAFESTLANSDAPDLADQLISTAGSRRAPLTQMIDFHATQPTAQFDLIQLEHVLNRVLLAQSRPSQFAHLANLGWLFDNLKGEPAAEWMPRCLTLCTGSIHGTVLRPFIENTMELNLLVKSSQVDDSDEEDGTENASFPGPVPSSSDL
jgi:hypothetical protein